MPELIRLKQVMGAVGLSRSSVWRLEQNGQFPKRIKIGERAVAWCSDEILKWIEKQKQQRGKE